MNDHGRVDRFYTRWARIYDPLATRTPGIAGVRRAAVDRMDLPRDATVLDMGCGPGPNFAPLRSAVGERGTVLGIDVAHGAVRRARARIERRGWSTVHVCRGDATRPPTTDCDAILATFVVGMFDRPAEVLTEWCETIGSGGRIGLVHFARSDRRYGAIPNLALRGLVLASTPGARRSSASATAELDRRVRAAHDALRAECRRHDHSTHWGGLLHVTTGIVA